MLIKDVDPYKIKLKDNAIVVHENWTQYKNDGNECQAYWIKIDGVIKPISKEHFDFLFEVI